MSRLSTFFVMGPVIWTLVSLIQVDGIPNNLYLGGLFDSADPAFESAFSLSLQAVKKNSNFNLTRSQFSGNAEFEPPNDSFTVSKKVCQMIKNDAVVAIIGPQSETSADHVQSMCQNLQIPHIQTHWDPEWSSETSEIIEQQDKTNQESKPSQSSFSVNIYPDHDSLSEAYYDFVVGRNWKVFTILYEDEEGLARLKHLLELIDTPGYNITIRQLFSDNNQEILKEMRRMKENKIVLDCSQLNCISEILEQAQQVRMTTEDQSYFITSLDMHLLNYDQYDDSGVTITGFRMFNLTSNGWPNSTESSQQKSPTLEAALVYDAVQLIAEALNEMSRKQEVTPEKLTCYENDRWHQGPELLSYIKSTEFNGLTGKVKLDQEGSRSHFNLDVIELGESGFNVVGTWNPIESTFDQVPTEKPKLNKFENLVGQTLKVSSVLNTPYFMLKDNYQEHYGNNRFEGYVVDIIDEISAMLGFNYEFKLVDDGKYGTFDPNTGEWNGLIKEILTGKTDIAIADLTISYSRESVVDFTMPFMTTGVSILYKKPMKDEESTNYFSFLSPLSSEIWIFIGAAYLVVSLALYIISRITPYEWKNPNVSRQEPDILENSFTPLNSLWFPIGSLMHLRNDIMPKAPSTRLIAGLWWFFILMMISSYLAYLSAYFITVRIVPEDEDKHSPISSVEDLAKQTEIEYGTLISGSTSHVFRDSPDPIYQRMWKYMESAGSKVHAKSYAEGIKRVQQSNGKYAFLMEATSIDYIIERECDLTRIGGLIDSKGYGIAMKEGSPLLSVLNRAVLEMQQNNRFLILKKKWWKGKEAVVCDNDPDDPITELVMSELVGIFIVLAIGWVFSFLIALGQLAWRRMKSS